MNPGRILSAIRAAFCPDDLDTDAGRERPGWLGRNGPASREAGSLTPLSTTLSVSCGRPGRQRTPADTNGVARANASGCEAFSVQGGSGGNELRGRSASSLQS